MERLGACWAFRPLGCVARGPRARLATLGRSCLLARLWPVGPACWRAAAPRTGHSELLGRMGAVGPFLFIKQFLNRVHKLTCKFNKKFCRNPKMMKPILLGSQNHALPVSIFGSHSPKIFQGRFKYFNMRNMIKM